MRIGQINTGYDATFSVDPTNGMPMVTARDAIQQSSNSFYLLMQNINTQQIAINTKNPSATVHISANSNIPALIIDQYGSGMFMQLRASSNGPTYVNWTKQGNLGLGSNVSPQANLHIINTADQSIAKFQQNANKPIIECIGTPNTGQKIVVISSNANVGINTSNPQVGLHVNDLATFERFATFNSNVYFAMDTEIQGNNFVHGDSTTDSDIRLKYDIHRIDNALDKIMKLNGYTFQKESNRFISSKRCTGLIAQEVMSVIPEVVYEKADGYLSLAYGNMMGYIIESIKELKEEMNSIRNLVCDMKANKDEIDKN
jgi:hypothetical protein